jgi:hypothetical protein
MCVFFRPGTASLLPPSDCGESEAHRVLWDSKCFWRGGYKSFSYFPLVFWCLKCGGFSEIHRRELDAQKLSSLLSRRAGEWVLSIIKRSGRVSGPLPCNGFYSSLMKPYKQKNIILFSFSFSVPDSYEFDTYSEITSERRGEVRLLYD